MTQQGTDAPPRRGIVGCPHCGRRWDAVRPEETRDLECPDCGKIIPDFANPERLLALCDLWQRRLRLGGWAVVVRLGRHHEMIAGGDNGRIDYNINQREATIRILDPHDAPPDDDFPYDPERVLVHELLHLHLAPMKAAAGSPEGNAEEQAINALACAFVELARQIPEA